MDYEYPSGSDKAVSPFAAEMAGTQTDPRVPVPRNQKLLSSRPSWQTYKYDWLGNTTSTDDDQHAFYERSLGAVTNNTAGKPYQVTAASQMPSGGANNGSFGTVTYDAAGNLTHVSVTEKTQACTASLSTCVSQLYYYWDEVGRLMQARRLDAAVTGNASIYVNYAYDANDERIKKTSDTSGTLAAGAYRDTLYIFDSLEIRRTAFDSASGDYPLNDTNEVPYLDAHGMRLGRVVKEPNAFGEPRSPSTNPLHVFLELPDHLGSESIVIDRDTSELVEARTYQPFGATESDYRPDRWKGFREDYGFTGKEEDIEVGLQYFGKRFLSPYLGRWVSPDPLAVHEPLSADLNLFAYVSGALLKSVDPVGLDTAYHVNAAYAARAPHMSFEEAYNTTPVPAKATPYDPDVMQQGGYGGAATTPALPTSVNNGSQGTSSDGDSKASTMIASAKGCQAGADLVVDIGAAIITPAVANKAVALLGRAIDGGRKLVIPRILVVYMEKEAATMPPTVLREAATIGETADAENVLTSATEASEEIQKVARRNSLGQLERVNKADANADRLAERINGHGRVRFSEGPPNEFDAVSDEFVAQSKPANFQLNKAFRNQAKTTFEVALKTGRRPYFHFQGPPNAGVLRKIQEYARRFKIEPVIDMEPLP